MVNLGPNYQFDVLLRVLLFQVKKQEIYREVNWPRDALLPEINHGHRRHLWTPTDFGHHQSDIWNDENGLGIEFVTIVVWFRIRLSFNGNENQSTWDTESISIRTNVLAVATFTFRCEKRHMRTAGLQIDIYWPTLYKTRQGYKRFLKSICDNFSLVVILKSIKSCFTLHTRSVAAAKTFMPLITVKEKLNPASSGSWIYFCVEIQGITVTRLLWIKMSHGFIG